MKLDKRSVIYRALKNNGAFLAIILFSGSSFNLSNPIGLIAVGSLALIGIGISMGWNYLYWKKYNYQITEDTFDIVSGVLRRDQREIPLHRIQNVDINQNIILRILGIAQVNLETAGGGKTEAELQYVSYEEAKRIQKKVRQLKSGKKVEAAEDEEQEEDVLFELQQKELALLSLTSVSGRAIAGIFFILSVSGGIIGGAIESIGIGNQLVILALVTILTTVAWLSGAAVTFNKYYGFRMIEADKTLEYERGLLKRASGSIPRNKVQSVRIQENPLQRLIGYSTVKIDTAGYSPSTAASEMGSEAAVPLAQRKRALELGRKIHYFGELDLQKIPFKASRRYAFRYSVLAFLLIGIGYGVDSLVFEWNYWLLTALLPIALVAAYFKWKNKGYSEGEEYFYTMNGFWSRTTSITPYYRLQTLTRSRTVFQRRLGLATIIFDTAGSSLLGNNPRAVDIDAAESEELYNSVLDSFQTSLKSQ